MIHETRMESTATDVRRGPGTVGAPYESRAGTLPEPMMRLTWGALIVGTVVAIAIQALLSVLGLAIGLSLAPVTAGEGLAIGAGIWWLITGLISLFTGGYFAGRFCYIRHPFHSAMHGIMTWCLVTVLSIVFIGWMGGVVAAGPMSGIVDDLVTMQTDQRAMHVDVDVPERVGVGIDGQTQQQIRADDDLGATPAAWWTFFALLLGLAAAGLGGYFAAPQNLRETAGGMKGTMRSANEPEP